MLFRSKLVELLGGQLEVTSTKGVGSNFFFSLTLEPDLSEGNNTSQENMIQNNFEMARILLVEDNPVNTLIAKTILEKWDCIVDVATNGQEAIDFLKEKKVDLILMDVRMPVMGGLEATQVIRQELNINIPIIALTGNAIKGDNEKCFEAGMNDYVSKPFEQKDLNRVLVEWLTPQEKPKNAETLVDLTGLEGMGDQEFIDRMVDLFVVETEKELEKFEIALSDGDTDKLMGIAHKIKPSVKYVCTPDIYDEVRAIENWSSSKNELLNAAQKIKLKLRLVLEQLK